MRPIIRRRPDGVIEIIPRSRRARAGAAAEATAVFALLGACAAFLTMLATVLVRHPMSVALAGSCLVFGLTTARWVSTGEVLPRCVARAGAEAESVPPEGSPLGGGPRGAA